MNDDIVFFNTRPTFEELYNIRRHTCRLNSLISALASCEKDEASQRASDLYYSAESFLNMVRETLVDDEEE